MRPAVGVLALQGDVEKHAQALRDAGAEPRAVRRPADLEGLAGIVLPGGESTTLFRLLRTSGLREPLGDFLRARPALATCAGLILLAREADELPDAPYGLLDVSVSRNAWGRQVHSFQEEIAWPLPSGNGGPASPTLKAVFIRAPRITRVGPGVEILARLGEEPVALRQGHLLGLAFHPELTGDRRVHRWFLREFVGAGAPPGLD